MGQTYPYIEITFASQGDPGAKNCSFLVLYFIVWCVFMSGQGKYSF